MVGVVEIVSLSGLADLGVCWKSWWSSTFRSPSAVSLPRPKKLFWVREKSFVLEKEPLL